MNFSWKVLSTLLKLTQQIKSFSEPDSKEVVHLMQTYFVGLKMEKVETLLFYYFFVQVLDL